MSAKTYQTWDEKLESLIKLAKAAGRYLNTEAGNDYHRESYQQLWEAYEEFCLWRHEEPSLEDEIKLKLLIAEHPTFLSHCVDILARQMKEGLC